MIFIHFVPNVHDQTVKTLKILQPAIMAMSRIRRLLTQNKKPLILQGMTMEERLLSEEIQKPTDLSIKVDAETLHVHKAVLCAVSDYFHVMLDSGMKESNERVIHIHDTRADVVETMMGYFYGKKTCIEWKDIKDYVDIVELWQLIRVKPVLEAYIADNILPKDCVEWFLYANSYHMEYLLLRIAYMINEQAGNISKDKAFLSLSLSNLGSLLSQEGLVHNASLLESCIQWVLADESSRKHKFSTLLCRFRLAECNPAYLKQMLNTYSGTLITDLMMQQEIIAAITSSFYFVDNHEDLDGRLQPLRIFHFNPTSRTLMNIGTLHDTLPWQKELYSGKCMTDSGIFCFDGRRCALINLVNLKVTPLPSLPESAEAVTAVAMGTKVFVYMSVLVPFKKRHSHHWQDCTSTELYATSSACITCVDTSVFLILSSFPNDCMESTRYVGKLLCYDLKKKHQSGTVDSTASVKQSPCAMSPESTKGKFLCYDTVNKSFSCRSEPPYKISHHSTFIILRAVSVDKDIYFPIKNDLFHYSTTEDSWTKTTSPGVYHHEFCMEGKLAVLDRCLHDRCLSPLCGEFDLKVYDNATDKWELSSLNLGLKFRQKSHYSVFSSYYA